MACTGSTFSVRFARAIEFAPLYRKLRLDKVTFLALDTHEVLLEALIVVKLSRHHMKYASAVMMMSAPHASRCLSTLPLRHERGETLRWRRPRRGGVHHFGDQLNQMCQMTNL
mmetsp:Transcript_5880/g.9076  ORF Transcript_5880/g.9076 Transcript_5880/m.9076 type:complete len:113 (-) Transcript_5880:123-461(-)